MKEGIRGKKKERKQSKMWYITPRRTIRYCGQVLGSSRRCSRAFKAAELLPRVNVDAQQSTYKKERNVYPGSRTK